MNRVENKEEIANILSLLLGVIKTRKLDPNNHKQYNIDIIQITQMLEKIAELRMQQLKRQLGKDYENIDFSFYSRNDNTLGGHTSNIFYDRNSQKLSKSSINHRIELNIANYSKLFFQSNNPEIRTLGCIKLIDTIFHEFRHFEQDCNMKSSKTSIDAINSGKQDILMRIRYEDIYNENYWNMDNEIDARLTAYYSTMKILAVFPPSEKEYLEQVYKKYVKADIEKLRKNANLFHEGKDGGDQDKETFFNQRVDEYIQAHPQVLDIYKSLQVEYNKDGKKKNNLQLIKELKHKLGNISRDNNMSQEEKETERTRIRNTYFDILADRLQDMTREDAKEFEKVCGIEGKGGTKAFYDLMKEHYLKTYNQKISDLNALQAIIDEQGNVTGVKDNFDAQKEIIKAKYTRIIQTVLNLSASIYRAENNIINGVDLEYISSTDLSPENQDIKDRMVKRLIEIYDKLETDEDFSKREKLENRNISQVLNAVTLQRCYMGFMKSFELGENESFSEQQIKIMMRALKAADAITVEGGRNYLEEFTKVPFINDILCMMSKDKNVISMRNQANQLTNSNIKRTVADQDKIIADLHLKSQDLRKENAKEELNHYGRQASVNTHVISEKSEWERKKLAMWRVSARQQGFSIGPLSKPDACGIRRVSLNNNSSCLINLEDLKKFGKSNMVMECVVNGKKYEAARVKAMEEQVQ